MTFLPSSAYRSVRRSARRRGVAVLVLMVLVAQAPLGIAAFPGQVQEAEDFPTKTTGGRTTSSSASGGAFWNIWANGYIEKSVAFDQGSNAVLKVRARGTPLGGVQARMVVTIDGATVLDRSMTSTFTWYDSPVRSLTTGNHAVRIRFVNDAVSSTEDRNLHADAIQFVQTTSPTPSPTPTTTPPPPPPGGSSKEAEAFATRTTGGRGQSATASGGAYWNLWSNGYIQDSLQTDGPTDLTIVARGTSLGGVWPTMVVSLDGVPVRTFTVSSPSFAPYAVPAPSAGNHVVRIAFTNDAMSQTEDRNLHLDVVRFGGGSSFTLAAGASADVLFSWSGGPGFIEAEAATSLTDNRGPTLSVLLNGTLLREARVMGPVERPFVAPFDRPAGSYVARFTANVSTVIVREARASHTAFPTTVQASAARIHQGGAAQGTGWKFTDYGFIEAPFVVNETGWYDLRVQGTGIVADVGPLIHLWLNRTVVAEGVQGAAIDLHAVRHLVAGTGYGLGASYENPASAGGATFSTLSATPTDAPAPFPAPALPVLPVNDPSGWPQYGRDNYNTRSTTNTTFPNATAASQMTLEWRIPTDGSVTGTPAVVDGRVYFGTWGKSFYCVDESTGALRWRTTLPNPVDGSAAVAQGLVVVSDQSTFVAMNATTGALAWTQSFGGHSWSSPTIDGDYLYVGLGLGEGYVAKLALQTGSILWKTATTPIPNSGARVWASPLVPPGSGLVIVGTSPGTTSGQTEFQDALLAYDVATGTLVWHHQLFPRDTNAESTHEITVQANRDISGTPHLVILGDRPVVFASQKHGPLWALDMTDGSLVHGSRIIEPRTPLVGSGGAAEGVEVASATDPDRVAGFDVATGDLLWEAPLPSTNFAPVAIGNGVVWIGSWEGHVHALDLHTGREVVRLDAGGGVLGGVSLADGHIFVGSLQRPADNQFSSSLGKLPGSLSMWSAP